MTVSNLVLRVVRILNCQTALPVLVDAMPLTVMPEIARLAAPGEVAT